MIRLGMKTCAKCKIEQDASMFHSGSSNGLNRWCKACMKIYDHNRHVNFSAEERERKKREGLVRRQAARKFLRDWFKTHPCIDCGESDPLCLDCDHRGDKKANVSDLVSRGSSIKNILSEIRKCDIRCANCHRRKTAKERNYYNF